MPVMPQFYRDAFSPAQNRTRRLHPEGQYLAAQDLNEDMSAERHARKSIGDAIMTDGQVVRGAAITVDGVTGLCKLDAGGIYVQGIVRDLPAADLTVPVIGEVLVGVVIEDRVITHLEDPTLVHRNFETLALDAHLMPRSPAVQELPRWGSTAEALTDTPEIGYRFFPVYTIRHGQLVTTSPQSEDASYVALIERYDRESNGHYVADGCKVTYLRTEDGSQIYSVGNGVANVLGRKVDRSATTSIAYAEDPELERINAEPHIFAPDGTGKMRIILNRAPVQQIHDVSVLTEKTVTVTRGQSTGGRDPLPDAQIQQILTVKQGGTTYTNAVDYHRLGDEVDWSPAGAEPSPGSSYQVTYRYKLSIVPTATDETSVTVADAVSGSEVDIDYSWRMPRIDLIAIGRDGSIERIKGVPSPYTPQRPQIPTPLLPLAYVQQRWTSGYPVVDDARVVTVSVSQLRRFESFMVESRWELSRIKLQTEALANNPAAENGIFVDNFDNGSNRDDGIEQTGVIYGGLLQLPVRIDAVDVLTGERPATLIKVPEEAISQGAVTQQYPPVPPAPVVPPIGYRVIMLVLSPGADNWPSGYWSAAHGGQYQHLDQDAGDGTDISSRGQPVSSDGTLRVRSVGVQLHCQVLASGPISDNITHVIFGGRRLPVSAPEAYPGIGQEWPGGGHLSWMRAQFMIPDGLPLGNYEVEVVTGRGLTSKTIYIGRGGSYSDHHRTTGLSPYWDLGG
ncbi:DUF4815 domain-containing protein [Castellaniella sp.]|uniref:DUF4815 domain-containing protein n=1 Tax=Castellaniella sp. TaxID=1955812 RepID=UPI002AFF2A1B|nr:DUF4815 domain-containing protein [Castellaniella sp.]